MKLGDVYRAERVHAMTCTVSNKRRIIRQPLKVSLLNIAISETHEFVLIVFFTNEALPLIYKVFELAQLLQDDG